MTALRRCLWIAFGVTTLLLRCECGFVCRYPPSEATRGLHSDLLVRIEIQALVGCVPTEPLPGWAFVRLLPGKPPGSLDGWGRGQRIRAVRAESGSVEVEIRSVGPDLDRFTPDDVVSHATFCDRCTPG